jgi:hypothetical protein
MRKTQTEADLHNTFWFGKFKEKPLANIPTYYLEWSVKNVSFNGKPTEGWEYLKDHIAKELARRQNSQGPTMTLIKAPDDFIEPSEPAQNNMVVVCN